MANNSSSRRKFVGVITTMAATSAYSASATPSGDVPAAQKFVSAWDAAWGNHDAQALGALHMADAITVNRFGTVVEGRVAIQNALAFLHENNGPFSHSTFTPQRIFSVRQMSSDIMAIHTTWQSPVMNPDGKIDPVKTDSMVVTFIVMKTGLEWKAITVDLHNVEKMDLPFSNPGQQH